MASAMSADRENDPDILSMIGASAALHISHIPVPEADRHRPHRPGRRRIRA